MSRSNSQIIYSAITVSTEKYFDSAKRYALNALIKHVCGDPCRSKRTKVDTQKVKANRGTANRYFVNDDSLP